MAASVPHVKVCGLTRVDDAALAQQLGAWALGMVFADGSPRRCSREQARAISALLRRKAQLCGVFVNAPLEDVVGASEELGLALLQLHGDEGPAYCAEAARRTGARVIKAAQVSGPGDIRALERFHVDYHLLDTRSRTPRARALRGGTGETFDWDLLRVRRSHTPLILSGGLEAGNVAGAIAAAAPYAVDTASGTEAAPGHKDPAKLAAFFDAVRASEPPAGDHAEPEMVSPRA
jgi:phosphoribosylanthranilate isomerase